MSSLSSSPWRRGAPHSGLARLISRIRARTSAGILGRPPRGRDLQRQRARRPARCQRSTGPGFEDQERIEDRGDQAIEADEDRPIGVGQVQPLRSAPGKDDELLAQGRVLGLEPLVRLEEHKEEAEQEANEPDHRIGSLPWIVGSARRMKFSVATGRPREPANWPSYSRPGYQIKPE